MEKSGCLGMECGYCRSKCPAFSAVPLESSTARGKARILEAYRNGDLSERDIVEASYICARCGYCDEICPVGAGTHAFLLELRKIVVESEDVPAELAEMIAKLETTGTPYGIRNTDWAHGAAANVAGSSGLTKKQATKRRSKRNPFKRGSIAYFPGCTIQAKYPELAVRTMELLRKCGIDPIPIADLCCGSPFLNAGMQKQWKENARRNLAYFKEQGIKKIIVPCPGCARGFLKDYPELLGKDAVASLPKIVHLSVFLNEQLRKGTLSVKRMNGTAIYHDPCHLGRSFGIIEEPRSIITKTGLDLLEFDSHGKLSECCGGGGVLQVYRKTESEAPLDKRVTEAVEKQADYLISACGHCESRFSKFTDDHSETCGSMKVLNIIDLFERADGNDHSR